MKLEQWLKDSAVTQATLAEACGVSQGTISRLLPQDGRPPLRRPSRLLARRIKDATGGQVQPADFFEDDDGSGSAVAPIAVNSVITGGR